MIDRLLSLDRQGIVLASLFAGLASFYIFMFLEALRNPFEPPDIK